MPQDPEHPTGVSGNTKEDKDARQRKEDAALALRLGTGVDPEDHKNKTTQALGLRIAGASWDEIAQALGYPTGKHAQNAFEGALRRNIQNDPHSKALQRDMAGRRLERLLRSVWGKATNPKDGEHLMAVDRALKVISQHANLMGLNAPQEVSVHTPTQSELMQWVGAAVSVNQDYPEEADMFDVVEAEIVEDGDDDGVAQNS